MNNIKKIPLGIGAMCDPRKAKSADYTTLTKWSRFLGFFKMKRRHMKITTTIAIGLSALTLASCKKYEEGPGISLKSRTERVANTWEVEEAMNNGNDVSSDFDRYQLTMLSDDDATLVALYSIGDLSFEFETDGTWEFQDNQEKIFLDFENDDADRTFVILRLMEDELWLREQGEDLEIHLKPY